MICNEKIKLMHNYLDGDLTSENETILRNHLEGCKQCQMHFHELSRTITLVQSSVRLKAPTNFTSKVMNNLPEEKKHIRYKRWFKNHPLLTTAAILFVFFIGSLLSGWIQDNELVVSKQEDIIIRGDTVIVPENVTVTGDLLVKNGNLKIKGTVDGDVTIVNGKLIYDEGTIASVSNVTGDLNHIDQLFKWIWYEFTDLIENIFMFEW